MTSGIDGALPEIDFTSPHTIADPYPALHALRERDPVHWHEPMKSWCLTRYRDVTWAYHDRRLSADRIRPFVEHHRLTAPPEKSADSSRDRSADRSGDISALGECVGLWLVFNDPPTHTRLRKLTQRAFTRKAMAAMRAGIERLVNELIDAMLDRAETDFVRDFAYPLPANVVADVLGVPREHVEDLKRWSDDLAQFVLTSRVNPDKYAVAAASLRAMNELFAALIEERRKHPGDGLMDVLIAARDGRDALSEEELVAFCVLLLFAGHETTTHFFSNGLRGLVLHPEQMADLRANHRDRALLSNAIDELLRWDGPVLSASRVVAEDVSRAGRKLLAGQRVYVFNGAANRDPEMFSRPDDLDIRRPRADKMVTFGYGIHLCLGIHLARLEGLVGFPILLDRLRDIELLRPDLEWTDTLVMRGPVSMPIRFRG